MPDVVRPTQQNAIESLEYDMKSFGTSVSIFGYGLRMIVTGSLRGHIVRGQVVHVVCFGGVERREVEFAQVFLPNLDIPRISEMIDAVMVVGEMTCRPSQQDEGEKGDKGKLRPLARDAAGSRGLKSKCQASRFPERVRN